MDIELCVSAMVTYQDADIFVKIHDELQAFREKAYFHLCIVELIIGSSVLL